jgi:hypothetical protein
MPISWGAVPRTLFFGNKVNPLFTPGVLYSWNFRREPDMADLSREITAYDAIKPDLEASHLGKWAVVHDEKLIDVYDTFEAAAKDAVHRFGRGPYLIRQIGSAGITLPASVLYRPVNDKHQVRL